MSVDARSPFVFDVRDVPRQAGAMRELDRTIVVPYRIGNAVMAVESGEQLQLHLKLESVMEGLWVSGEFSVLAMGECGRCLEPLELPLELTFQQLFLYPGKAEDLSEDDEEAIGHLDGDLLDTSQPITDAIVLAIPFQPLCDDDCPGVAPNDGVRLVIDPDPTTDPIDSRWASLQQLVTKTGDPEER